MNKRGFFGGPWLVLLVIFLCGLSIYITYENQQGLSGEVVSPLEIIKIQDELKVFEMRERALILKTAKEVGFDGEDFGQEFLEGVSEDMREFIFDGLYHKEQEVGRGEVEDSFLEKGLYNFYEKDGGILIERREAVKRGKISGKGDMVNFPVEYEWKFEEEYFVSEKDSKIVVEVAKNA